MENYNFVRMPIGSSKEDKKSFIDSYINIFPEVDKTKVGDIWDRYAENGYLQVIWDVERGIVVSLMKATSYGAVWEHSSHFLKKVLNVKDFDIEGFRNRSYGFQQATTSVSYNIDDLLDKISEFGIEKLSKSERDFIENIK